MEKYCKYLEKFKEILQNIYNLRVIGLLLWFFRIHVIRDELAQKIWFIQDLYIKKIASKFYCNNKKPLKILLITEDL